MKKISDNVYIVKGKVKSCIYDLNTKKLYHINDSLAKLIENVVKNEKTIFTEDEHNIIKKLEELNVLESTNSADNKIPDIMALKKEMKIDFAWIEICNYCNLKCLHCYNESSSQCYDNMSFDDFKYICQELLSFGIKRIQLIGGEPFCNKNIKEMLTYVADKFEFVEVFTNGTMIDKAWCDFFKEFNINLAFSIYSYNSNDHDYVTQTKGSHKKTVHAVELANEYGINYRIATIHMKGVSIDQKYSNTYSLNREKDVIRMVGRGNLGLLTPTLLKRKLITKSTFSKPLNPNLIIKNISGNRCFSTKIYISTNLEVYPCVMERRVSHGNLKKKHLISILKKEIINFNVDVLNECKDCEFRYACHDCRPDSIIENIYAKPYYCCYDVYKGEFLNENEVIANILGLQDV